MPATSPLHEVLTAPNRRCSPPRWRRRPSPTEGAARRAAPLAALAAAASAIKRVVPNKLRSGAAGQDRHRRRSVIHGEGACPPGYNNAPFWSHGQADKAKSWVNRTVV